MDVSYLLLFCFCVFYYFISCIFEDVQDFHFSLSRLCTHLKILKNSSLVVTFFMNEHHCVVFQPLRLSYFFACVYYVLASVSVKLLLIFSPSPSLNLFSSFLLFMDTEAAKFPPSDTCCVYMHRSMHPKHKHAGRHTHLQIYNHVHFCQNTTSP